MFSDDSFEEQSQDDEKESPHSEKQIKENRREQVKIEETVCIK